MKIKILIISSEFLPDPGGIGNHAYHLAKELTCQGYEITVLADIVQTNQQILLSFKQSLSFTFIPIIRKSTAMFTYCERLLMSLRLANKNDSIICSGKFSLWLMHLLRLFYPNKKTIAIVHGSELLLPSKLQRRLISNALAKFSSIVAVSNYTLSFIPDFVREIVECFVIPNGIDNDEFLAIKRERQISFPLQLITIGSVTARKGQENIIKALPRLLKQFPGLVYHVVGSPLITEALQELCNELSVENNVIFYGKLGRAELLKVLNNSSVKLMLSNHTSSGDFEGFGIAILEANACGLPAISSNIGGTVDAVADKFSGRLVDPLDDSAVAEALADIVKNYKEYSSNAIQWANDHDWKIMIKKYTAVIEKDN